MQLTLTDNPIEASGSPPQFLHLHRQPILVQSSAVADNRYLRTMSWVLDALALSMSRAADERHQGHPRVPPESSAGLPRRADCILVGNDQILTTLVADESALTPHLK